MWLCRHQSVKHPDIWHWRLARINLKREHLIKRENLIYHILKLGWLFPPKKEDLQKHAFKYSTTHIYTYYILYIGICIFFLMKTSVKSLLMHDRHNFTIKFIKANYLKVGHIMMATVNLSEFMKLYFRKLSLWSG